MLSENDRSFRNNNLLPSLKPTQITDHFFETGHPIDKYSFKVIGKCGNFDLPLLELLHINHLKPSLNNYDSSVDLWVLIFVQFVRFISLLVAYI